MNRIRNIVEPRRLLLSWQRPMAGKERRTRHIVGEIEQRAESVVFRYLNNQPDFQSAIEEGFKGYPSFALEKLGDHSSGVLDAFLRRLPPRKREDFSEYLAQFRLPDDFAGSDMALLAYTGAKLPGDGFELIPDLSDVTPPLELVVEVAGFRHQNVAASGVAVGDDVQLVPEPTNPADSEAIAIHHSTGLIGYVPRPYLSVVAKWLRAQSVDAVIERINGKPERPLVYLFLKVS